MARRLIGLDIGTNAVTVAEVRPGEPPRLDLFGQVALGRDTMREGEITDDAAVTDAVARLRAEVGLKKVAVRLGLASPRVVVRQIEMPQMTREELGFELMRIWDTDKKTVIFVTHNISEAILLADRVVAMTPRPGRIARIVDITLSRPRTIEMEFTQTFKSYSDQIREVIYHGTGASRS